MSFRILTAVQRPLITAVLQTHNVSFFHQHRLPDISWFHHPALARGQSVSARPVDVYNRITGTELSRDRI